MNAQTPITPATRAFVDIENLIDDAHGELQIVDYLIEAGQNDLAYRATNAVFDKLRKMRAVSLTARGKEVSA